MIKFTKMQGVGNDFICMNYEDVYKYNLKIFRIWFNKKV